MGNARSGEDPARGPRNCWSSLLGEAIVRSRIGVVPLREKTMSPSATLRKLCQVRDLIRDCLEEELTLADLSQEAELSAWHFLRAFRESFGETPHAFLTRMRLERAKELLTVSSRPVTEICFDV